MVEHRAPARLPSDQSGPDSGCRLFIECTHLKLDLEMEPIFASLALYDLSARRKISENFYFDANSQSMMAMLSQHISRMEITTLSQRCIINITYPSPDIFIVVRVSKFALPNHISLIFMLTYFCQWVVWFTCGIICGVNFWKISVQLIHFNFAFFLFLLSWKKFCNRVTSTMSWILTSRKIRWAGKTNFDSFWKFRGCPINLDQTFVILGVLSISLPKIKILYFGCARFFFCELCSSIVKCNLWNLVSKIKITFLFLEVHFPQIISLIVEMKTRRLTCIFLFSSTLFCNFMSSYSWMITYTDGGKG